MCNLWPSSVQVQLYSNQACHRAGLGKGKGEGTSTNIWSIVTQWSWKEAFLATLRLCSDGSGDVHGGVSTGDATWLEGGIFATLMLCSDGSKTFNVAQAHG